MSVLRFAPVGPTDNSGNTQLDNFVQDPFGDASVAWMVDVDGVLFDAPGINTHRFKDDDGRLRMDVNFSGARAGDVDTIASQFRSNGNSGTRLTKRKDGEGSVTESATLTTRQWRNVLLITGEGSEVDEGRPTGWPAALEEHRWL